MSHTIPTETHLRTWNPAGDPLGRQELAKNVVENILTKMQTPNVLGIYGDWGSGKTTFLHYLRMLISGERQGEKGETVPIEDGDVLVFRDQLKSKDHVKNDLEKVETVYFEPWKYEYAKDADLLFALLECINEKMETDDGSWNELGSAVVDVSRDFLKEIAYSFFRNKIGIDFSEVFQKLGVGIDSARIERFGEILPEYEAWFSRFDNLQKLFAAFINSGLRKQKKEKLIVFIDDLDRCLPENAIKLLEAIKNFLYQENVIFVIAIDQGVVSEMIEKKYGLHRGYGGEYLDKIINFQIILPRSEGISLVVDDIFASYGFSISKGVKERIVSFCGNFLSQPRKLKKVLRQTLMRCLMYPNPDFSWNDDEKVQYAVFAEFLISKYPSIFLKSTAELERFFREYSKSKGSSSDPSGASDSRKLLDVKIPGGFSEIDALFRFEFFDKTRNGSAPFDWHVLIGVMVSLRYIK